jgi:hypothetical protein
MVMATDTKQPSIKLDWYRLLGFDQATGIDDKLAVAKLRDPRLAKLGAKSGVKTGLHVRRSGWLTL